MTDLSWQQLDAELTAWRQAGLTPRLWWRDDDAVDATPALARLIRTAGSRPLALAVIPKALRPALPGALPDSVSVLPHGFAHTNHEPPAAKKSEFGAARPMDAARRDAETGLSILDDAFGSALLPLFVPPWNRIAPPVLARLPDWGFHGVSTYNDRQPDGGPASLNTHVDVLNWRHKRKTGRAAFIGEAEALALLTGALARRRTGAPGTDPSEPVGLLTHHLEHDAATWSFLDALTERADVDWVDAAAGLETA